MSFTRKQRRRAAKAGAGRVMLLRVFHDDWCNAPLFECTCDPDIRIENATPETMKRSLAAQAEHVRGIKARIN